MRSKKISGFNLACHLRWRFTDSMRFFLGRDKKRPASTGPSSLTKTSTAFVISRSSSVDTPALHFRSSAIENSTGFTVATLTFSFLHFLTNLSSHVMKTSAEASAKAI